MFFSQWLTSVPHVSENSAAGIELTSKSLAQIIVLLSECGPLAGVKRPSQMSCHLPLTAFWLLVRARPVSVHDWYTVSAQPFAVALWLYRTCSWFWSMLVFTSLVEAVDFDGVVVPDADAFRWSEVVVTQELSCELNRWQHSFFHNREERVHSERAKIVSGGYEAVTHQRSFYSFENFTHS